MRAVKLYEVQNQTTINLSDDISIVWFFLNWGVEYRSEFI